MTLIKDILTSLLLVVLAYVCVVGFLLIPEVLG